MAKEVYISSRTRAFSNKEEAVLARAYALQRQYGNLSGNQPYVPESQRRNNTRIINAVNRMLG